MPGVVGIAPAVLAEDDADDREVLHQDHVGRDFGNVARSKADHQNAALPADARARSARMPCRRRDRRRRRRPAVRSAPDPVAQVLGRGSRSRVGAMLAGDRELSALPAAAMTRAPRSLPISMAARPTPPAAPSTSSVSPAARRPRWCEREMRRAVGDGKGRGRRRSPWLRESASRCAPWTTTSSAWPPPRRAKAITRSPGRTWSTPGGALERPRPQPRDQE